MTTTLSIRRMAVTALALTAALLAPLHAQDKKAPAAKKEEPKLQVPQDEPPVVEGLAHYIVYSKPQEGMIEYSTFQFPKLGYVRAEPDLLVTEFEEVKLNRTRIVTKDQPNRPMNAKVQNSISITLNEADTEKLKELTKKATGQRVLIVVDGRPVSAPVIMSPIESGEVTISGGRLTSEGANRIVGDLQKRSKTTSAN